MIFVVILVFGSFFITNGEAVSASQCPVVDDILPVYIPDEDCTKYWKCSNGQPYQFDCPDGLHFNPKLNVCDWPQQTGCPEIENDFSSSEEQPENSSSSSEEESDQGISDGDDDRNKQCAGFEISCPVVDGEYPVYIPLPSCVQFCQCSNGIPYLHDCPKGLHFNPTLNVCDWPENAGCNDGNSTDGNGETTTEGNTDGGTNEGSDNDGNDSNKICPEVDAECPAVDSEYPVYIPLPNCVQFCQCSNGLPYLHDCPKGLHFNAILNVCDWPEDAGCNGGNSTDGSGETTTEGASDDGENDGDNNEGSDNDGNDSNKICPEVDGECPAVDGEYPVYIPLPNCVQFCQCSNGLPYLHECPKGLHFNPILNVCDWPEDAGCNGGNSTDGSGETTTESASDDGENDGDNNEGSDNDGNDSNKICPEVDAECPAVDGEYPVYIPLPNCVQFCQCSNGLPYLHDCPEGLHFNPILNVCDWPEDAGCNGGNSTDGSGETTTESGSDDGENDGGSNEGSDNDGNDSSKICPEVDAECPAVDGEYPVYIPLPNCVQFCQCSNGLPYLHDCPKGLHFNAILNVCDWPEDAGCNGGNSTDGSGETTTEGASDDGENDGDNNEGSDNDGNDSNKICPEVDGECPAVDGEYPVYIPLPNCVQFCQCSNGLPYLHECPEGLHFNPILNVCDWPEDAGCNGGNSTDGSGETTTESASDDGENDGDNNEGSDNDGNDSNKICPEVDAECPAVDGEYPVYIPLPNCVQFCQCSNGLPYLHDCPEGLHFNPILNVCDWPEDAGCNGGNSTDGSGETTTESGSDDGENDGGSNEGSDNDGNDSSKICPEVDAECPAVDGEYPVYIPLPNCVQFCQCSNGLPYLHDCPEGLHFNPILNVCDWPEEDAGCNGGNSTGGSGETTTESASDDGENDGDNNEGSENDGNDSSKICPEVDAECPAVDGEYPVYTPLPNCVQFCQCSNGISYLHDCPEGLYFNPILNVCDWPEDAGCNGGNSTDGSSETTTESGSDDGENDGGSNEDSDDDGNDSNKICPEVNAECPAVDGEYPVYIPLPNCVQFCQCSNGLPYLHDCPEGLHFNPILNVCDWPEDAGCNGGNSTDGSGETTTESGSDNGENDGGSNEGSDNDGNDSNKICPEVDAECPAVDGEYPIYIPLPNCVQFCQCSNGLPYLHDCPEGLHFNPILNVCDWPEDVGCNGGNSTDGSGETTTESASDDGENDGDNNEGSDNDGNDSNKICPEVDAECPAVDGEYPVYIPLPNCAQFCQCSNGLPYLHDCPEGLHFNPILNVCDWPEDAGCNGGNSTDGSGETTTESTSDDGEDDGDNNEGSDNDGNDSNKICPEVNAECPAVDGEYPVYIPLPNCVQFCQCSNGLPYLHDCPEGLHFNPILNVCDWPEDAGCNGSNSTDGSGETTTESASDDGENDGENNEGSDNDGNDSNKICPEVDAECPAVDGEYPVYIPLPNCAQFCQCSNGLPYLHDCPEGLHFNPILNVCDWPEDAGCNGGNSTDGSGETTTESTSDDGENDGDNNEGSDNDGNDSNKICPDVDAECPAVDGEYPVYIPLPNCVQFCQCSNGIPYLHDCPEGLHFNPILNVCDWPEDAGCNGGNSTDGSSETTTESGSDDGENDGGSNEDSDDDGNDSSKICPEVDAECPAIDGEYPVYIPLPNCVQFCQCSNGLPYLHDCPEGLHFNSILNVCDWPEAAGCTSGNSTNESDENNHDNEESDGGNTDDSVNQPCLAADKACPAVDGAYPVYIPLPNCTQFCQCSNGKPYLHNCPGGLHFNPVLNVCDWPEDAQCGILIPN